MCFYEKKELDLVLFINATKLNLTYVGFSREYQSMRVVAKSDFYGREKNKV